MENVIIATLIGDLKTGRNPRTHPKKQLEQIAQNIRHFGFINPILIDGERQVIAGHGRLAAARLLGMERVPTLCVDHLTPPQVRAYVIADNKLAEKAGWDRELLALELKELSLSLDFDITVTGLETPEIDLLLTGNSAETEAETIPQVSTVPITRPGDLWLVGKHRLLCGNSLEVDSYNILLGEERARMVFADPPYNVPISGHVSGLGKVTHAEFAMASGEMTPAEFTSFLQVVFSHLRSHSDPGSLHYICMDWRHMLETLSAGSETYSELKNLCVWTKTNAGMGSFYRSQHELVFVYKNGDAPHVNNIELGQHGRYRTNVWLYAGMNSFHSERNESLSIHPTVKPVALIADAIMDASHRGEIILDPFAGSGSTLLAAEKTGRRGYGIEIDPRYVDLTLDRLQQKFGLTARLADGATFEAVSKYRKDQP